MLDSWDRSNASIGQTNCSTSLSFIDTGQTFTDEHVNSCIEEDSVSRCYGLAKFAPRTGLAPFVLESRPNARCDTRYIVNVVWCDDVLAAGWADVHGVSFRGDVQCYHPIIQRGSWGCTKRGVRTPPAAKNMSTLSRVKKTKPLVRYIVKTYFDYIAGEANTCTRTDTYTPVHLYTPPTERKQMNDLNDLLSSMDGLVIPGGCEHCDAEQELVKVAEQFHELIVRHDNNCPAYQAMQQKGNQHD